MVFNAIEMGAIAPVVTAKLVKIDVARGLVPRRKREKRFRNGLTEEKAQVTHMSPREHARTGATSAPTH